MKHFFDLTETLTSAMVWLLFAGQLRWYLPLAFRCRRLPPAVAALVLSQTALLICMALRAAWWALAPDEWRRAIGQGLPNTFFNYLLIWALLMQMLFQQRSIPAAHRHRYPLWRVVFYPERDGWVARRLEALVAVLSRKKSG
ncbi:hypothetical protein [Falsirhodobacter sp. 20TX0035]|uniref:hypothetical protein n=1 Tax=Falsirhodobacter sp. 20TX0035 TaxID=3022019 RepID=UPI00232B6CF1|nr:hypothetical protein [Falsirhodobacter sp. 20TX0035]MDB6454843.1 hypothetical protein [Falsirhodobacter sp. 20TX0035]